MESGSSGERLSLSHKVQEEVFQGAMECWVDSPRATKVTGTATYRAQATLRWGAFYRIWAPRKEAAFLSAQDVGVGGGEHRGNFGSSMGASHQTQGGLQAELAVQQSSSKVGGSGLSSAKEAGEKQRGLTNKSTCKLPWGIPQVPEEAWKGFFIGWNWEKRGKMLKKK